MEKDKDIRNADGEQPIDAHLADARVVMLCGVSGSGKTYLAKRLARDFGHVRVSSDALLWNRYGDAFPSLPAEQRQAAFMAVNAELERDVARLLAEGKKVAVDVTHCKRAKRDRIRELCARFGVDPVLVYLATPPAVLRQRLATRQGIGPDDQLVPEQDLARFLANFQPPAPSESPIIL